MDVKQPADLVEEVARITGYDDLPLTIPDGLLPTVPAQDPARTIRAELTGQLRELLLGSGFNEIVTYSLTSAGANEQCVTDGVMPVEAQGLLTSLFVEPIKLANPMTEEQTHLRTSMLPSMLHVYDLNRRHSTHGLKFFEAGRVYWPRLSDLPDERAILALAAAGPWEPRSWKGPGQPTEFIQLKGVMDMLFDDLNVNAHFSATKHPALHPGRAAQITIDGQLIGYLGELHPAIRQKLDLPEPIVVSELDLDALATRTGRSRQYQSIRKFPAIVRQLTVAVGADTHAEAVQRLIAQTGGDLLTDTFLADVFPLAAGKRSLSYTFTLQSDERTLTDEEANQVRDHIMAALARELGAVQR